MASVNTRTNSLSAQRAWLDAVMAGEAFQVVEPRLRIYYALLQDFNAAFRSNRQILANQLYAAGGFLETSRILKRILVFAKLSLPAFKFVAQLRGALRIPR